VFKTPKSKEYHQVAMSTDSSKSFIPEPSQGDFWGGYMLDTWFYKLLAIFPLTGFLGIDHLALRSPLTAILKVLVNIFFWGAWYIYDILQVMMDNTFVAKYGMSTPWGPKGHGYKLFKDLTENNLEEFPNESTYSGGFVSNILFVLYAILTLSIGFSGIPLILGGDFNGGILKLFSNFLILPFIFNIIFQIFEFAKSSTIQKEGLPHAWPMYPMLTIFEKYPATGLLSEKESKKQLDAHTTKYQPLIKEGKQPLIPELFYTAMSKVYEALNNIPVIAAFNTLSSAKGAALAASDMAQTASKVGQKLASAVEKRITQDPDAILDKVLGPAEKDIKLEIENPMLKQKGGGEYSSDMDMLLMGGMVILVLGGIATALLRKILPSQNTDGEYPRKAYDRDDLPPVPGRA
jgi:hypothetical protein